MKWLKITVVFFLVTLVKCGPTRSEKDLEPEADAVPPAPIKLERIDRVDDAKFTVSISDNLADTTYLIFLLKDGKTEVPYASEVLTPPSSTFTFNDDIRQLSDKTVDFEILVLNDKSDLLGFATHKEFKFPKFPTDLKSITDGKVLRVEGNMETMTIKDGTCVANGDTQYCSFTSSVTSYVPCDNTNGIPVCDVALNPDPVTPKEGDLKSVILSYINATAATIKISFNDDTATILIQDVIVSSDSGTKNLFNKDESRNIGGTFPGTDTRNIIIVKETDAADPWTTNNVPLPDRELIATRLSNNIIEGRWKILDYESTTPPTPGNPVYRLRKTTAGSTAPDDDIEVDCSHLEQTYCFGYFPTLEATKTYTLTVAHKKDNKIPGTYNETQQVESIPQAPPKPSEPELGILSRHMTRHANQLMADVNICFEHLTPQEGGAFSHYEMLIINEKGQWLKHRILEEEEGEGEEVSEGRLCFAPFTINTKDFDLTEGTKVVISQRGVDGFTVLATGEAKLL